MRWFGVVQCCLVWFGGVRRPKKRAKIKKDSRCPPTHAATETLTPAGSVEFGGVWRGLAAVGGRKGGKKKRVVFFWWLGLVRRVSVGFGGAEDTKCPGGQEGKAPQVAQWWHKQPFCSLTQGVTSPAQGRLNFALLY